MSTMAVIGLLMIFMGIMVSGMGGSLVYDSPGLGAIVILFGVGIAFAGGCLAVS